VDERFFIFIVIVSLMGLGLLASLVLVLDARATSRKLRGEVAALRAALLNAAIATSGAVDARTLYRELSARGVARPAEPSPATRPAPAVQRATVPDAPRAPRPANADGDETVVVSTDERPSLLSDPRAEGGTLVSIPASDAESPPFKRVTLGTLLLAVGIKPGEDRPAQAVLSQAQSEIKALADLAWAVGEEGEDVDFAELGSSLTGINRRLDVVGELFDPALNKPHFARLAKEPEPSEDHAGAPEETDDEAEPSEDRPRASAPDSGESQNQKTEE
jgi:hypothetical protein